jgi:hypothetical protein
MEFAPQLYQKSLYFDGHECPDVVLARKKYIEDYNRLQSRSQMFGGEKLDICAVVDPKVLQDNQETVQT